MKQANQLYQSDDQKMEEMLRAWKSKSLNSKSMQHYKIPLDVKQQPSSPNHPKKPGLDDKVSDLLPEPKIIKITQSIFCIYLGSTLIIHKLMNPQQKQRLKSRTKDRLQDRTFFPDLYSFHSPIKFVTSNPCSKQDIIYVGLENELHIMKIQYQQQKTENGVLKKIYEKAYTYEVKKIQKLKGVTFIRQLENEIEMEILVTVTNDKVSKYKVNAEPGQRPLQELRINFDKGKGSMDIYREVKTIHIICENNIYMYLFGSKQGILAKNQSTSTLSSVQKVGKKDRRCEYLYFLKFNLDQKSSQTTISPILSVIDHVFQIGIFSKSKIFQCGPSVFLISLYEQIIVVKYHFQKYVVWDNISLAPSKSNQKKGQLILADKIVMVYTQMNEIYAHNIFFSFKQSKLKFPRIDNFRGNDSDEEILYDAIVLQYQPQSFMKVLFYFKQADVYTPSHKVRIHKDDKVPGDYKNNFNCAVRCIQQSDPLEKLAELFKNKKTPQQISEFVQRFGISQLDKMKCQWSVSQKNQKDIQNLLLQIKSNQYIQNELTQILKSNPHDLKFLSRIQKKQIERYKRMLATKILKNDQNSDPERLSQLYKETGSYFTKAEVEQIKQIIKWVMESIMFQKKIAYSKNFLEFMEYEFIDIGKLKAASLKQEIKLLSCKGYQKRLQYFLNSFKYMILANFENIFQFLIQDKNVVQIEKFFKQNFPFILPKFQQSSEVYAKKNASVEKQIIRARKTSFAPSAFNFEIPKKQQNLREQDKCQLWEDKFGDQNEIKKIETKISFTKYIQDEIIAAINNFQTMKEKEEKRNNGVLKECLRKEDAFCEFTRILDQFVKDNWFLQNKSKQHSIIQCSAQQLRQKMQYLKRIGVFHLLVKLFYRKIQQGKYTQAQVDRALENLKKSGLIPQSFEQNILARRQIYKRISQQKKQNVWLPLLQQFLILQQTQYFHYLFEHYRSMLLKQVKSTYDHFAEGLFKQKFQIYLNSELVDLPAVIDFIDEFEGNSNDDIRMDVFLCIKKMLRVSNFQDTDSFVNKLLQKEILKHEGVHSGIDMLVDQAKIAFGFYFYQFFYVFQINQTYQQLINETTKKSYDECKILKTILTKYTNEQYKKQLPVIPGKIFPHPQINQPQGSIVIPSPSQTTPIEIPQMREHLVFQQRFGQQKLQFSIIQQPLKFFGILLYLVDMLRFQIKPEELFDKFIELMLQCEDYDGLVDFVEMFAEDYGDGANANDDGIRGSIGASGQMQEMKIRHMDEQLLEDFYYATQIQDRLIQNIIVWVRKIYKILTEKLGSSLPRNYLKSKCEQYFSGIQNSFIHILDILKLQTPELIRQKSFLSMLKNMKDVEPTLVCYVLKSRFENFNGNYLQQNSQLLNTMSGFMFMIRLLAAIPEQKFSEINEKQRVNYIQLKEKQKQKDKEGMISVESDIKAVKAAINNEIYIIQCIYEQFKSASTYNLENKQQQSGLIRFFMELAMKLIQDKEFFYCEQVIIRIIKKQYYFRDVFFQFMSSIKQTNNKPSQQSFKKFIRDFIQASHEKNLTNMFNTFMLENEIRSFQGPSLQQTNRQSERQSVAQLPKLGSQKTMMTSFGNKQLAQKQSQRRKSAIVSKQSMSNKQKINFMLQKITSEHFGQSSQMKQVESSTFTLIIFQTLIQSRRIDEAYYFLVRNPLLSVLQAYEDEETPDSRDGHEAFALISVYLKCLKQYLCTEFYPTFAFYRLKLETLLNQFDRRDIIKDINIAISRMKQKISQQKLRLGQYQNILTTSNNLISSILQKKVMIPEQPPMQQPTTPKPKLQQNLEQKNEKIEQKKTSIKNMENILRQLNYLYQKFMHMCGLDPEIKLNQEELRIGKEKLDNMRRNITPDEIGASQYQINIVGNNQNKYSKSSGMQSPRFEGYGNFRPQQLSKRQIASQQAQKQKQLQQQIRRLKQDPKMIQLQNQISHQLRQTKLLSDQYEPQNEKSNQQAMVIKKSSNPSSKLPNAQKAYNQLKQKQKSQLESIKDSYKSATAEKVNSFLEELRLKKSKIYERSDVKSRFSKIQLEQSEDATSRFRNDHKKSLISPPDLRPKHQRQGSNLDSVVENNQMNVSRKYEVKLHGVDGNTKQIYMPVTINQGSKHINSRLTIQSKQAQQQKKHQTTYINTASGFQKSQVKSTNQHQSYEELHRLFEDKEPQCLKYIQKLEIVKNNVQVGLQIVKNVYNVVANFQVFVRFLGYLLYGETMVNKAYHDAIQQRAYKIAYQAIGIQYKIPLKQLFSLEFFLKSANSPVSQKQYYRQAYEQLRAGLLKLLSKPQTNIHGVAILYRFGFGSDNLYYFMVYEDYMRVLLKEYWDNQALYSTPAGEKKIFMLAEKLRTHYANLSSNNQIKGKQTKFEQLMVKGVPNDSRRKILVKEMLKILDRRGEMLTGQKQSDLRAVLQKLS